MVNLPSFNASLNFCRLSYSIFLVINHLFRLLFFFCHQTGGPSPLLFCPNPLRFINLAVLYLYRFREPTSTSTLPLLLAFEALSDRPYLGVQGSVSLIVRGVVTEDSPFTRHFLAGLK